ncbi:MAG: hypothetical protein ACFFDS_08140 [Candidatus Thorarchaeota archaeon]
MDARQIFEITNPFLLLKGLPVPEKLEKGPIESLFKRMISSKE